MEELRTLRRRGLEMQEHPIEADLSNHRTSIHEAAFDVLRASLNRQLWREMDLDELVSALKRCDMDQLAAELQARSEQGK